MSYSMELMRLSDYVRLSIIRFMNIESHIYYAAGTGRERKYRQPLI